MDWLKEKSQSIFIILLDYAALPLRRENPPGVSLRRYARTRVAVRGRVLGAPRCEWQCDRDCHSCMSVNRAVRPDASGSAGAGSRRTQVLVAVRSGLPLVHEREQGGTHGREWQ